MLFNADLLGGVEEAHSGLDDHRMIDPDDIGLRLFETGSRLGDNDLDTESVIAVEDVPPKRARTDDGTDSDAASDGPAETAAPGTFKKPEDVDLHAGMLECSTDHDAPPLGSTRDAVHLVS